MTWLLWVVVAGGFAVGELHTQSFYLAPFALGAGVAAGVTALGGGTVIGAGIFALVSLLTLLTLRPVVLAHLHAAPRLRTGGAALVGREALVLERISNDEGVGCVRIGGEVWTARGFAEHEVIESGTTVQVLEIRGATALVAE